MFGAKGFLTLVAGAYASCQDAQCDDTAWLQLQSEPDLPQDLKALRDCSPDDLGCMAQQQACSLATKMASDWPSLPEILEICHQLQDVCLGRSLSFKTPEDVPGASGQTDSEMSLLSFGRWIPDASKTLLLFWRRNMLVENNLKTGYHRFWLIRFHVLLNAQGYCTVMLFGITFQPFSGTAKR